jgi:thioredoxin 1
MGRWAMAVVVVVAFVVAGLSCGRQVVGPSGGPRPVPGGPGPQAGTPTPSPGGLPVQPSEGAEKPTQVAQTPTEAEGNVIALTDADFDAKILAADKPALVDFWAEWCGPCRQQAPIVEQVAGKYAGKIIVGKLNVDEQPKTAHTYKIEAIPTLIFFKHGKEVDRIVGLTQEADLSAKIEKVLLGQ